MVDAIGSGTGFFARSTPVAPRRETAASEENSIVAGIRRLTELSGETLEANQARVDRSVERARLLPLQRDVTSRFASRIDRNGTEISDTIQRSRVGPDVTAQAAELGDTLSSIRGSYANLGRNIDITV